MPTLKNHHVVCSQSVVKRTKAGTVRGYVERVGDFPKGRPGGVRAGNSYREYSLGAVLTTLGH
jgi:hypothetical protein